MDIPNKEDSETHETSKASSKPEVAKERPLNPQGVVGFHYLSDQEILKWANKPIPFNILTVGESGLGKSTFIKTLFNTHFDFQRVSSYDEGSVRLEIVKKELREGSVKLAVTIAESKGFGDQIDKREGVQHIVEEIYQRFENYLKEELLIQRSPVCCIPDTRFHVCFYFLSPTGHTLKSSDLLALQALQNKVNVIPVIAKGDAITKEELARFKVKITSELNNNSIKTFKFPTDESFIRTTNESVNALSPFAIIGGPIPEVPPSKPTLSSVKRTYPWGTIEVNSPLHSDVSPLRSALLSVNLAHLINTTNTAHYEEYRQQRLLEMGFPDGNEDYDEMDEVDPATFALKVYENLRSVQQKEHLAREEEIRARFVLRVQQKEEELREAEKKLNQQFDVVKRQVAEDRRRLEERKRQLEEERGVFERRKTDHSLLHPLVDMHHSNSSGRFTIGTPSLIHKKNKKPS